ncbi:MAG: hypothetical protein HYV09_26015 [Deltaproteobacteria bacterium]|nr:hypothetical protein [Deltaproteobacteria bacterium]
MSTTLNMLKPGGKAPKVVAPPKTTAKTTAEPTAAPPPPPPDPTQKPGDLWKKKDEM